MTIVASGPGAVGVAIDTVLNGNLSLGNTAAVGEGSTALRTTSAINGSVTVTGFVGAGGTASFSATLGACGDPPVEGCDPEAGSALSIGSDVTGGILNSGVAEVTSTSPAATI